MPTHHMYRFKDNGTPECLIRFMEDLDILDKIKGVRGLEFIEIVNDGYGKPSIVLHADFKVQAAQNSWNHIHLSLSHLQQMACAVVIIER